MSKLRTGVCFLLLAFAARSTVVAAESLAWKFRIGDEHRYRMAQDMKMEMTLAGEDGRRVDTSFEQVLDLTWKIEELNKDGNAVIQQSVDRVRMEVKAPGQEMLYDSDKKESPTGYAAILAPLFKALVAQPSKLVMTPRGEIVEVLMTEELLETMERVPGGKKLGKVYGGEAFKSMLQQTSFILPGQVDLKPNYDWTRETIRQQTAMGPTEMKLKYRYQGPREVKQQPYEAFRITTELEFPEQPEGVAVAVTEQASEGEVLFSREQGRLESTKLEQKMEMASTRMQMQLKQKVMLERRDVEEGLGEESDADNR